MNRVLVTGGTGFLGYPCLQQLYERGYEVHAVANGGLPESVTNITGHTCDLLDTNAVANLCNDVKASHLLHLAWHVDLNSEENIRWIIASMDLLKAFHKNGGYRATFAGTCFEYDLNTVPLNEDRTPKGPHTVYGASKHTLQEMVRSYAAMTDLSYSWARVFYLYGPRENPRRLVAAIITALLNNKRAACTDGRQIRDYLHVQDAANALVTILDNDIRGAVNVGSGIPISVRELIYTTADLLSAKDSIDYGAKILPANEPLVIVADTDKLKNLLDWQPTFDLVSGISDTIEWWQRSLAKQEESRT